LEIIHGRNIVKKKEFQKLYDQHKSITKLSQVLNKDWGTIKRYMLKHDIQIKPKTKYSCNDSFFSKEMPETFYWAGFIAADGCVIKKKKYNTYILKITLSKRDEEHLNAFKKCIKSTHPIKSYTVKNKKYNDSTASEIQICSKQIFDDLSKFNIVPRKTHIYHFPEWVKDHKYVNHFIRGYFDGDGSFSSHKQKNRNVAQFSFSVRGTEAFLKDMYQVIDKNCNFKKNNRKIYHSNGIAGIGYSGNNNVKIISNFLYKNASVYLIRKYKKIEELIKKTKINSVNYSMSSDIS